MKKLFSRDSKLWVAEFPEPPGRYFTHYSADGHTAETAQEAARIYGIAVESARQSAVEVVNMNDSLEHFQLALGIGDFMQEGQLYDVPKGWTVEQQEQRRFEKKEGDWSKWYSMQPMWADDLKFESRQIAHLVPVSAENAQGEKAKHEFWDRGQWIEVSEERYQESINNNHHGRINGVLQHGDPESKRGIVATGIPEPEQPKK